MPLQHSASPQAFKANVSTLMKERGKSPHVKDKSQALAIAYDVKRRGKRAAGGMMQPSWFEKQEVHNLHTGPILSAVPGRTDRHNMSVPSGSYVLPADSISHLGQSNTLAGMKIANNMFGAAGPYGVAPMKMGHGMGLPKPPKPMALSDSGGSRGEGSGAPVPVVTAGGEFIIKPEVVARIGGGDLKHGHKILDEWVLALRKDHLKKLRKLPPPAKS
jgi:hypothetical protein